MQILDKKFLNNFHDLHKQRYGYSIVDEEIELVNVRLTAIGKITEPKISSLVAGSASPPEYAYTGLKKVIFNHKDPVTIPILERHKLLANNIISGPAILEQSDTTIVIYPGWQASVLVNGHIQLRRKN